MDPVGAFYLDEGDIPCSFEGAGSKEIEFLKFFLETLCRGGREVKAFSSGNRFRKIYSVPVRHCLQSLAAVHFWRIFHPL